MSRAFGDWNLKDPEGKDLSYEERKVICVPEFSKVELKAGDSLLISCDGITEHLENNQVFDKLTEAQAAQPNNTDIVLDSLLQAALDSGSKDNMTTALIEFRDGAPFRKRDAKRVRTYRPGPLWKNL